MISVGDLPNRRLEEAELPELQQQLGPGLILNSVGGSKTHCTGLLVIDEREAIYATFDYSRDEEWREFDRGPASEWQEGARAYVEWRVEQHEA